MSVLMRSVSQQAFQGIVQQFSETLPEGSPDRLEIAQDILGRPLEVREGYSLFAHAVADVSSRARWSTETIKAHQAFLHTFGDSEERFILRGKTYCLPKRLLKERLGEQLIPDEVSSDIPMDLDELLEEQTGKKLSCAGFLDYILTGKMGELSRDEEMALSAFATKWGAEELMKALPTNELTLDAKAWAYIAGDEYAGFQVVQFLQRYKVDTLLEIMNKKKWARDRAWTLLLLLIGKHAGGSHDLDNLVLTQYLVKQGFTFSASNRLTTSSIRIKIDEDHFYVGLYLARGMQEQQLTWLRQFYVGPLYLFWGGQSNLKGQIMNLRPYAVQLSNSAEQNWSDLDEVLASPYCSIWKLDILCQQDISLPRFLAGENKSLKRVDLRGYNADMIPVMQALPKNLNRLSVNSYDSIDARAGECLGKLMNPSLQRLSIWGFLSEEGAVAVFEQLKKAPHLEQFHISSCTLTGSGALALAKGLQQLGQLTDLELNSFQIDSKGMEAIAKALCHHKQLKKLTCNFQEMSEATVAVKLVDLINGLPSLERLTLSNINGKEIGLPSALCKMSLLRDLSLDNCFRKGAFRDLFVAVNNMSLTRLRTAWNDEVNCDHPEILEALINMLTSHRTLQSLIFVPRGNNFFLPLAEAIRQNPVIDRVELLNYRPSSTEMSQFMTAYDIRIKFFLST